MTKFVIPVAVSLAIHGVMLAFLMVGWEAESKPRRIVPPNYIDAKLVQLETKSKKKASAKKKPKKIDLTAKRKEQQRLKQEAERKRQAQIKREEEEKAKRAAEEQKKKDDALRKEADKRRRQKEQEQRLQQEFEQALLEEQGMLQEEEYAVEAQSFQSRIQQRIQSNWSRPPSARTGMRCLLRIQLVPTGRIVSVDIVDGSGNGAFDRSAIQAVKKVELFPEVKEMSPEVFERYFRKFTLSFNPQDLRL